MNSSNSVTAILAKIAYQINPDKCRYPVYYFSGWTNPHLCHFAVAESIKSKSHPKDSAIVFFGEGDPNSLSGSDVTHSIIVDADNNIRVDTHTEADLLTRYVPNVGYFVNDKKIGDYLLHITIEEFVDTMLTDKEYLPSDVEEAFSGGDGLAQSFVIAAYVIFKYMIAGDTKQITPGAKKKLEQIEEDVKKFLTKYKVGYRQYLKIIKAIKDGKKYDDAMDAIVVQFGKDLKPAVKKWTSNRYVTNEQLNLMKAFGTYVRKRDSNAAKNHLLKNVNKTHSRSIVTLFSGKEHTIGEDVDLALDLDKQKSVIENIELVVKEITGEKKDRLTVTEAKQARKEKTELYKQYNELRRSLLNSSKEYIRMKVRQYGHKLYPYENMIRELDKDNVKHNLVKGFKGLIDEDGNLYTMNKQLIDGKPSTDVTMNPDYNPKKDDQNVFTAKSPSGDGVMYFYTLDYKKKAATEKFNKVAELGKKLPAIRRKWYGKISTTSREGVIAAILEMIYTFAARIGDKKNQAAGEPTYGMSTIQLKHIKKQGTTYKISYPGKKGTIQRYELKNSHPRYKQLSKVIDAMMADKKAADYLWTWDGELIPVGAIRRYWRGLDSITKDVGVHKIRNAEATRMAKELLAAHPFKKKSGGISQAAVEKWFKEEMKKIGARLHHQTGDKVTGMTAIQSYVDIELQKQFFHDLGLRTPSFLRKYR